MPSHRQNIRRYTSLLGIVIVVSFLVPSAVTRFMDAATPRFSPEQFNLPSTAREVVSKRTDKTATFEIERGKFAQVSGIERGIAPKCLTSLCLLIEPIRTLLPNVFATSAGPNSPGTVVDDATVGNSIWNDVDYAKVSDLVGAYASVGASCFLSGTKISTPSGTKTIETLSIDNKILSYDKESKNIVVGSVIRIFSREEKEGYFVLKTKNREVNVTSEHPFLTTEGWKIVRELQIDDVLLTENGEEILLSKVFIKGEVLVYNLSVDNPHTYYANGFVVHNKSGGNFTTVKLVNAAGDIAGDNKAAGEAPASYEYMSFGSSSDLWGLTLGPSDVNNANFGVVENFTGYGYLTNKVTHYLKATNFGFSIPDGATINGIVLETELKLASLSININHIRITAYYTEATAVPFFSWWSVPLLIVGLYVVFRHQKMTGEQSSPAA